ncbi:MAG: divalent-cation tolerance protein CutA [Methanomassiliicoccales archaeon]|nr:divalent-cation tolerance protein CutA [Methanomassiliicoccales archaeon]
MFATVFITVPDEETAASIGTNLVSKRLAACANFFPCRSIYRWKGKIENESEFVLLLKIRTSDFHLVTESILALHPDEIPCIIMEEIAAGHQPYLDWIRDSTVRT